MVEWTRASLGHTLAAVLAAGLGQSGVTVDFAGIITNPCRLWCARGIQAGVVISASHNPFHDNGVKLFSGAGMKFPDAVRRTLEGDILKHRHEPAPKDPPALVADEVWMLDIWISCAAECFRGPSFLACGWCWIVERRCVQVGPELFRVAGRARYCHWGEPDGRNINANCGSMHLEGLQKRVWRNGQGWVLRLMAMRTGRCLCVNRGEL